MRIAMAQINPTLGDFQSNSDLILSYIEKACERRCDLVVFPELSLFGYCPVDLLERPSVIEYQLKVFENISKKIPKGLVVIFGLVTLNSAKSGKRYKNSAALLEAGKKPKFFHKQLLPTYDVFDESRHFEPGKTNQNIIKIKGTKILITICEDIWAWPMKNQKPLYDQNPLKSIEKENVDLVLNLSASPFTKNKKAIRQFMVNQTAKYFGAPVIYVNIVGAQDELIFDGGSFAVDKKGKTIAQCLEFEEDFNFIDLEKNEGGLRQEIDKPVEVLRRA
jgi:NAD+ synthase (glutamine-hydrolysing)